MNDQDAKLMRNLVGFCALLLGVQTIVYFIILHFAK